MVLFQNFVSYQGLQDQEYLISSYEERFPKVKALQQFKKGYDVKVSKELYRVTEFKNVSKLNWVTHHTEVVVSVTVKSMELINAKGCFISVVISPHTLELYPHLSYPYRIPTFRIKEISPPMVFFDEVNITEPPYIVMVRVNVSNWNTAQEDCRQRGMELLSLDSLVQWISLMEKTHRVFQELHYLLWESQIIFISHKETKKFVTNVSRFSLFYFKSSLLSI